MPEFLSISARLAVCPEARELIERLEPGLHQFFPIAIRRKQGNKPILRRDGSELSTPYYLVNIRSRFDAILVERSDVIFISGTKNNPDGVALKYKGEHGVVLRRDMVTGHHLWQGIYQAPGYFFISDILANEIMERKWKGWDVTLLREE